MSSPKTGCIQQIEVIEHLLGPPYFFLFFQSFQPDRKYPGNVVEQFLINYLKLNRKKKPRQKADSNVGHLGASKTKL